MLWIAAVAKILDFAHWKHGFAFCFWMGFAWWVWIPWPLQFQAKSEPEATPVGLRQAPPKDACAFKGLEQ
ncbi:hypothetical protein GCM10008938_10600 [Deinococcus roseus]|uniref:Uncharacterized protein n=1 Tax=Deinococcus roseus TaxID=392414 RepID=A0ABQ2CYI4_9DEIO|nr:hypothetical protein GCM10008938_10600 [Deinococcus roseus]